MIASCVLSKAAKKDLAGIYRYTREKFGKAQAETYVAGLKQALEVIAEHPFIGADRPEFNPPVRMHPHELHIVFYTVNNGRPLILRIVAVRQHWQRLISN